MAWWQCLGQSSWVHYTQSGYTVRGEPGLASITQAAANTPHHRYSSHKRIYTIWNIFATLKKKKQQQDIHFEHIKFDILIASVQGIL